MTVWECLKYAICYFIDKICKEIEDFCSFGVFSDE